MLSLTFASVLFSLTPCVSLLISAPNFEDLESDSTRALYYGSEIHDDGCFVLLANLSFDLKTTFLSEFVSLMARILFSLFALLLTMSPYCRLVSVNLANSFCIGASSLVSMRETLKLAFLDFILIADSIRNPFAQLIFLNDRCAFILTGCASDWG